MSWSVAGDPVSIRCGETVFAVTDTQGNSWRDIGGGWWVTACARPLQPGTDSVTLHRDLPDGCIVIPATPEAEAVLEAGDWHS